MQRKITVAFASAALVVSLLSIWLRFRPVAPKIDRAPIIGTATGIGEVLADETLKVVQNRGRIVLVTDYDHAQSSAPRDFRWEKFQEELRKHTSVTISATEIVEFDPNEPMVSGCPSVAFKDILERHAAADAVVFFVELPEWIRVNGLIPQRMTRNIIAVDNMGTLTKARYSGYFTSGILSALIGRRIGPAPTLTALPKTPREWFDKYYQVYTPHNYDSLPD